MMYTMPPSNIFEFWLNFFYTGLWFFFWQKSKRGRILQSTCLILIKQVLSGLICKKSDNKGFHFNPFDTKKNWLYKCLPRDVHSWWTSKNSLKVCFYSAFISLEVARKLRKKLESFLVESKLSICRILWKPFQGRHCQKQPMAFEYVECGSEKKGVGQVHKPYIKEARNISEQLQNTDRQKSYLDSS